MKLEHLRYITIAAEKGSVSKAAESLFITQPGLSKMIRDMETEVGFPVFVRHCDGISLTQKGIQFVLHAKRIMNEAEELLSIGSAKEKKNRFSLSSVRTSLVFDCFLQLVLEHNDDSNLHFSICENGNNTAIDDVYTQDAELGIIYVLESERQKVLDNLSDRRISYHKVCPLEHQIILSCNHPLLKQDKIIIREDLYSYGMLRYGRGMMFGNENADSIWYNAFLDLNEVNRVIEVYDRATMHNLLVLSDFFTLGTSPAIYQESLHKIVSVPFSEPSVNKGAIVEMGYIHLHSIPYSDICSRFIEILTNSYKNGSNTDKAL